MDVIEEIVAKLQTDPHVEFKRQSNSITIHPPNEDGFSITLLIDDCYEVNFEGWHEEFTDPQEALDCIAFGLSPKCRLKVSSRGDYDHRWTLEFAADDGWTEESTTGLLFYPFWRKPSERYLQNQLFSESAR